MTARTVNKKRIIALENMLLLDYFNLEECHKFQPSTLENLFLLKRVDQCSALSHQNLLVTMIKLME